MIEELKQLGRSDMVVVCGGVIPPQDYEALYTAGVTAVYGPGTNIAIAARHLVDIIHKKLAGPDSRNSTSTKSETA